MISKFVTVYPGHIDLPDMGQDTTPANERRYSNDQLASVFERVDTTAQRIQDPRATLCVGRDALAVTMRFSDPCSTPRLKSCVG